MVIVIFDYSYKYILYNNKKPKAKLVINVLQENLIQYIIFDHSNYSYIVKKREELGTGGFDPVINKDNLNFSNN